MTIATFAAHAGNFAAPRPGLLRRLVTHIVRTRMISVQRRLLNELPDGMLKDIGLARSDIDYVAQALADGYDDPTRSRSLRVN